MKRLVVILGLAGAMGGCASIQGDRSTDAGERFVRRACAGCHATGAAGTSPDEPAPPFRTLGARLPGPALEAQLAAIAARGHGRMPPIYMTPDEIDAVARYIRSVAGPDRGPERRAAAGLAISRGRAI